MFYHIIKIDKGKVKILEKQMIEKSNQKWLIGDEESDDGFTWTGRSIR